MMGDLDINANKIAENASRYSKKGGPDDMDILEFAAQWAEEKERSKQEDKDRVDRQGVDDHIAESMTSTRDQLSRLGGSIKLSEFPFDKILPSVREFVAKALHKGIARSIQNAKDLGVQDIAIIYSNRELEAILKELLGASEL